MQYVGGKARMARWLRKEIAPFAVAGATYLEPFLGGANSFRLLAPLFSNIYAGELNINAAVLWRAVADGWEPPLFLSREEYQLLRNQVDPSPLRSFAGFGCSFGGKWFGGYAVNARGYDYVGASRRAIMSVAPVMRLADIRHCSYDDWCPSEGWVVYCDPPYAGVQGYGVSFDHGRFWGTVRHWSRLGALVFVSEYSAPSDFTVFAEKQRRRTLSAQDNTMLVTERLFKFDE
jgi:DNA adenine methylase